MPLRLASAHRIVFFSLLAAATATTAASRAWADNQTRITILEENDSLYFNSDRHYTQGLRISVLGPDLATKSAWNEPFDMLAGISPIFAKDGEKTARRYSVFLGQSIFTPQNLTLKDPSSHDRPYGGWLYVGSSLLQETNHSMLENVEVDLGTVGPSALGKEVQNDFHQLIDVNQAQGWSHQIQNEPGVAISYERLWRLPLASVSGYGLDVVPEAGATVGNVFTYGDIGGLVRIGRNLGADYGPTRVRPALSGTDYFDASNIDGNLGYYIFFGAQGRAVGRNIFLDGNSFRQSPSVAKRVLVADLEGGFSLFWADWVRLDLSVTRRTREFIGQTSEDRIGTAALTFVW